MMAYLSYMLIFASAITSVVLFFFPGIITYKGVAMLLACLSFLGIFIFFCKYKFSRDAIAKNAIISLFLVFLYNLTPIIYSSSNNMYNSFNLVLCGQIVPIAIVSAIVAKHKDIQYEFKTKFLVFSLLFTIVSFVAAFFPNSSTSAGYVETDYNLNYQSTSYVAAYASSFAIYGIFNPCSIKFPFVEKMQSKKILCIILMINFITILISGGRGGLVLYIIQSLFAFFLYNKYNKVTINKLFPLVLLVLLVVFLSINFVANSNIESSGFNRILSTVLEGDSNGRNKLRDVAIKLWLDRPFLGHGLGSIFFEINWYTHNCFTDALVEIGIFGLMGYIVILIKCIKKGLDLIKYDQSNMIWMLLFIDGFVMSLFSGYYLVQFPLVFSVFFLFSLNIRRLYK